jgi:hypothetical protein
MVVDELQDLLGEVTEAMSQYPRYAVAFGMSLTL